MLKMAKGPDLLILRTKADHNSASQMRHLLQARNC